MSENLSSDDLVPFGRFSSPVEASLAQGWLAEEGVETRISGAATANWLNYYGSNLVGARLLVKQSDFDRATQLLAIYEAEREPSEESDPGEEAPTPPLIRAYRAAVFGAIVVPPLLTTYSIFLVFKHRLWEPQPGEKDLNWRFYAMSFFQIFGLLLFWWIVQRIRYAAQ